PEVNIMDVANDCGLQHSGRFSVEYRRRYGETPSQTVKRHSVLIAALASMSSSVIVPAGAKLLLTVGPIEADAENSELARHIADELTIALIRAGVSVSNQAGSAPHVLTGAIRGSGRQACLIVRLIETATG